MEHCSRAMAGCRQCARQLSAFQRRPEAILVHHMERPIPPDLCAHALRDRLAAVTSRRSHPPAGPASLLRWPLYAAHAAAAVGRRAVPMTVRTDRSMTPSDLPRGIATGGQGCVLIWRAGRWLTRSPALRREGWSISTSQVPAPLILLQSTERIAPPCPGRWNRGDQLAPVFVRLCRLRQRARWPRVWPTTGAEDDRRAHCYGLLRRA